MHSRGLCLSPDVLGRQNRTSRSPPIDANRRLDRVPGISDKANAETQATINTEGDGCCCAWTGVTTGRRGLFLLTAALCILPPGARAQQSPAANPRRPYSNASSSPARTFRRPMPRGRCPSRSSRATRSSAAASPRLSSCSIAFRPTSTASMPRRPSATKPSPASRPPTCAAWAAARRWCCSTDGGSPTTLSTARRSISTRFRWRRSTGSKS